jgi:hypothetical protein
MAAPYLDSAKASLRARLSATAGMTSLIAGLITRQSAAILPFDIRYSIFCGSAVRFPLVLKFYFICTLLFESTLKRNPCHRNKQHARDLAGCVVVSVSGDQGEILV